MGLKFTDEEKKALKSFADANPQIVQKILDNIKEKSAEDYARVMEASDAEPMAGPAIAVGVGVVVVPINV